MLHRIIMTATILYIIFTAIPFVPGVEIGLGMILILGAKICFLVYVSTVIALTLAYLAGRLIPAEIGAQAFGFIGLTKAQRLMERLAPLSAHERVDFLLNSSPAKPVPYLVRYRYLALAVLFNLPGNTLIGGGGGIALLAGMTRLFPFPLFLLTIAVAVSPVPLIISLTGLEPWW